MHFLLTNDDGIDAVGIAALENAVSILPGVTYTVVAPLTEQSQCGHRVTTHGPLVVNKRDEQHYSVVGTPADCVRIALFGLHLRPDYVLSGINAGGNMGQDIVISGTVAAAREAAYHGLPAMALSHYLISKVGLDWPRMSRWTKQLVEELLPQPLLDGEFWNVGFPHLPPGDVSLPERVPAVPCRSPLNVAYESTPLGDDSTAYHYTARYADRPVDAASDVDVCFGGRIAVSKLRI
ncbi:5'/3'-nucleotidase SurE [soil metagenome]